ncbi:MAG: YARHG domain-containing protein [bacterium]|nr:YARHG domain-containing protein [bacterium]
MRTFKRILATSTLCLALGTSGFISSAIAEKRLALVLGNDSYADVPSLQKAVNDATALDKKLTALGFEVIQGTNLTRRQMVQKIQDLASRISIGDKVVFFYAGHGVQIDRSNLLLATDIPATGGIEEEYVRFEGFDVQKILDMIRGRGAQTTIMILDACRNNPFKASKKTRAIGGLTRGLVPIRETRRGTFIMYSADEGQEAFDSLGADDTNNNSVFTRSLLEQLDNPDLELTELAKNIQLSVLNTVEAKVQNQSQAPFYVDRLFGKFFFHEKKKSDEELFWSSIKNNTNSSAFKIYLQVYPQGKFKTSAEQKIQKFGALDLNKQPTIMQASFLNFNMLSTNFASFAGSRMGATKNQNAITPSALPLIKVGVRDNKPIFHDSSRKPILPRQIKTLSCLELWRARNEIYDRNGYCFVTPLGIQYFNNATCNTTSSDILKKPVEHMNVKLIQLWENKKRCKAQ